MSGKSRSVLLSAVLAFAMIGAACGSDDAASDDSSGTTVPSTDTAADGTAATDGTTPAGTATDGSAAPADGSPIKIGYAAATESDAANIATVDAVNAWEEWTNANGGIGGHPVEVIVKDSKNDAATLQSVVQELVESDDIAALVLFEPYAEGAISDYVTEHQLPIIGATGYNVEVWSNNPYYFSMTTTQPSASLAGVTIAAETGATKFGPVVCAEVAACAQIKDLFDPALAAVGIDSAGLITVEFAAPSYTAECLALIDEDVDYIAFNIAADPASRMAQDCLQQGYDGKFYISHTAFDQVVLQQDALAGTEWVGGWFGFPWYAEAAPAAQYRDVMAEYAPDTDLRFGAATSVWASLELFKKTMADATGEVTNETVLDAYYGIKDETLDGLLPQPLTFTEGEPAPKVTCYWPFTWTNGDETPTPISFGESGNGAEDDLRSSCEPTG